MYNMQGQIFSWSTESLVWVNMVLCPEYQPPHTLDWNTAIRTEMEFIVYIYFDIANTFDSVVLSKSQAKLRRISVCGMILR